MGLHPTQVNMPHFNPNQTGWYSFAYLGGLKTQKLKTKTKLLEWH